eukprot:g58940.t1
MYLDGTVVENLCWQDAYIGFIKAQHTPNPCELFPMDYEGKPVFGAINKMVVKEPKKKNIRILKIEKRLPFSDSDAIFFKERNCSATTGTAVQASMSSFRHFTRNSIKKIYLSRFHELLQCRQRPELFIYYYDDGSEI